MWSVEHGAQKRERAHSIIITSESANEAHETWNILCGTTAQYIIQNDKFVCIRGTHTHVHTHVVWVCCNCNHHGMLFYESDAKIVHNNKLKFIIPPRNEKQARTRARHAWVWTTTPTDSLTRHLTKQSMQK